jgi:LDH2 family malate/lactate/ureidoglycolate dehydrogenase
MLAETQQQQQRVDGAALEGFARSVLEKAGCEAASAEAVARSLTEGSLRGVDSHGTPMLPPLVDLRLKLSDRQT